MSWNSEEGQQIGRIEAKVDDLVTHQKANGKRLSAVETWQNKAKGVVALLALTSGIIAALIWTGCAHAHVKTYYPDGALHCNAVTTVLGQGDVAVLVESDECPDTIYESDATGLSDNGVKALEKAVEAAVKSAVPVP